MTVSPRPGSPPATTGWRSPACPAIAPSRAPTPRSSPSRRGPRPKRALRSTARRRDHSVTPRLSRIGPLAAVAFLGVTTPRTASAQVGATTDIIVGTVTGPDSQPLAGATVEVTSRETQSARQLTTDARGRFTLLFPDGGGRYDVLVRYIGMAPARVSVGRQGDEDRIVANVQMGLSAITMEAVSVTARAPRAWGGAPPARP